MSIELFMVLVLGGMCTYLAHLIDGLRQRIEKLEKEDKTK